MKVEEIVHVLERIASDARFLLRQKPTDLDVVEGLRKRAVACEAGAALLRAMEWKPIESFPRTNERILMLVRGEVYTGTWNGGEIDHTKPNQPTHWMPVPAPPEGVGVGSREQRHAMRRSEIERRT